MTRRSRQTHAKCAGLVPCAVLATIICCPHAASAAVMHSAPQHTDRASLAYHAQQITSQSIDSDIISSSQSLLEAQRAASDLSKKRSVHPYRYELLPTPVLAPSAVRCDYSGAHGQSDIDSQTTELTAQKYIGNRSIGTAAPSDLCKGSS